jgi:drug/metabolite transporter (DMT)-like permease
MKEEINKGIKYMLFASFLFALMGAVAKELSNSMSSVEVSFFRNVFGVFIILFALYKKTLKVKQNQQIL